MKLDDPSLEKCHVYLISAACCANNFRFIVSLPGVPTTAIDVLCGQPSSPIPVYIFRAPSHRVTVERLPGYRAAGQDAQSEWTEYHFQFLQTAGDDVILSAKPYSHLKCQPTLILFVDPLYVCN